MTNKTEEKYKCDGNEENKEMCPMVIVNRILSGKWKILILWHLSSGTLRFSELKNKLTNVTQKMLTTQLRSLEEDKLILRTVYPVVPPKVEYSLTETGEKFIPILNSMHDFGEEYIKNLLKENETQENKE